MGPLHATNSNARVHIKGMMPFSPSEFQLVLLLKGNFHVQSHQCFSIDPHLWILRQGLSSHEAGNYFL